MTDPSSESKKPGRKKKNDRPEPAAPEITAGESAAVPGATETPPAEMLNYKKAEGEYGAEQLEHLSDLEHVRERPSMYIGDTTLQGLHHLVYEVVDNSIDEAMAGYASIIFVTVNVDGSVTVEDNGRGIPVEIHSDLGFSTLQGVMTVLKFGGKFSKGAYQTSGGLHGVGVTVVNFLSEWCEVDVCREGHVYHQEYERGVPTGEVGRIGSTTKVGTKTTFKPDPQIFENTKFNYDTLYRRLQELAFLNRGIKITFRDERTGDGQTFHSPKGIIEFVTHLNRTTEVIHADVIYIAKESEGVAVEVALQYSTEYKESCSSFVNNINTVEGGTHLSGFRAALTRVLNKYAKDNELLGDLNVVGEDFREGLSAVVAVRVPEPQFGGQTKTKLGNEEVEGIVSSVVGEGLSKYLEENPKVARNIVKNGIIAAEAREAARKAKQLVRERKGALHGGGLPGKLLDCISKDVSRCELFLVEGNSAGGSAGDGRFRDFQAVLPLRGKVINAYKSREDKVLANEEVRTLISAIGMGFGAETNINKLRYNKVIIMADADVDGSHIRTLLLTFFYRQMYDLIARGHVYVAQPPLYQIRTKEGGGEKKSRYVQTDDEMKSELFRLGMADCELDLGDGRRLKGESLEKLCQVLRHLEEPLETLERRGISLKMHITRKEKGGHRLPIFHVFLGSEDTWLCSREELDAFVARHEQASGELAVADAPNGSGTNGEQGPKLHIVELHEVRTINRALADLAAQGFSADCLTPIDRTGLDVPRYILRRGQIEESMEDLRGLLAAIRTIGERGMNITRFKGLGEMDADELRNTTLDPAHRTLLQVRMDDVSAADDMFRILMGENVEPRREFIEKHALEVRNLDV